VKILGIIFRFNDAIISSRPYIDQYVRAPNRLAFGERTVIVMSSKVAQKSYGTEKRYAFT
jgi:recombining binding protein suppressor of hairless